METSQEFSARARRLLATAEALTLQVTDAELSQWMAIAKTRGMTWVEGLQFAIAHMQNQTRQTNGRSS